LAVELVVACILPVQCAGVSNNSVTVQ
jgi:hypothetical protein